MMEISADLSDLELARELVYDQLGFKLTNLEFAKESLEYGACSFQLNQKKIEYRPAKRTPTNPGQFESIWKRSAEGLTVPFDSSDDFDFLVISSRTGDDWGQFIFPKAVLVNYGVVSKSGLGGKRGIRVYAPWDMELNKQAEKTQSWQCKCFLTLNQLTPNLSMALNSLFL